MNKWSNSEIEYLKNNYSNTYIEELQKTLNRSYKSIIIKACRLDLLQNKDMISKKVSFSANDNFFTYPNVLNSYWAGFIGADGCVSDGRLNIHITSSDRILLDRFKQDVGFKGNISIGKARKNASGFTKESVKLIITNKKIINDLSYNFNIIPNKSLILEPPTNLSYENSLAYIVGNIDGDGTIRIRKDRNILCMKFVGTVKLLNWIKSILSNIIKINSNVHTYKNISEFVLMGKYAEKIGSVLNKIPVNKLERKWEKIYG